MTELINQCPLLAKVVSFIIPVRFQYQKLEKEERFMKELEEKIETLIEEEGKVGQRFVWKIDLVPKGQTCGNAALLDASPDVSIAIFNAYISVHLITHVYQEWRRLKQKELAALEKPLLKTLSQEICTYRPPPPAKPEQLAADASAEGTGGPPGLSSPEKSRLKKSLPGKKTAAQCLPARPIQ